MMKSTFDKATRDGIIARIEAITINNKAQWGKMTVYQMLKHSVLWEEMIAGSIIFKRVFIGRIFGKIALRSVLKDDSPLGKNSPTIPALIVTGDGDIEAEKKKWIALLEKNANFNRSDFIHPFFGKMTKEQVGWMAYKHADHHLRQFGG